jgi:hypothetical protein
VSAPLSDDLLRDIEEKAKACPIGQDDGPWEVLAFERKWQTGERGVQHRVVCDTKAGWDHPFPILEVDPDGYCTEESTRALADYLRSLAPPVVLSLLERLKKAESERDRLRALVSEAHDVLPDHEVELRRRLVEAL